MYLQLCGQKPLFRLLLLLHGDTSSDIQCELLPSSLDHPPEFEALSYVWGDPKDTVPITLQGRTHYATRNLHAALHSLRYPDSDRTLWVDALCINQGDTDERNHQIRLMGRIYSSAKSVVAWLGKVEEKDSDIIRFINTVGDNPDSHWSRLGARIDPSSLLSFLENAWWDRIWTAQEAVLAKDLVFQLGDQSISGNIMIGALRSFNTHITSCCHDISESWSRKPDYHHLVRLIQLQRDLEKIRTGRIGRSFSQLVCHVRHRNATDPRDKVYGLLGMTDDGQNITVDYNLSVEMAYERFARELITKTSRLDLFCHLSVSRNTERNLKMMSLPSWVPDWTRDFNTVYSPSYYTTFRLRTLSLFNACGSHLFDVSNSDEQGSLKVSGIIFDEVTLINPSLMDIAKQPVELVRDWRIMAGVETQPNKSYPSGGTILDAFWRTLSLDLSSSRRGGFLIPTKRAGLEDRKIHDTFWYLALLRLYNRPISDQKIAEDFQNRLESNVFCAHIHESTFERRFFYSKRGYMGLAPENVKLGDLVCVLAGGRVPFILRGTETAPKQITNGSEVETVCSIIGDAYLHGIMDGEAVKKIDEGEESFQTFRLI